MLPFHVNKGTMFSTTGGNNMKNINGDNLVGLFCTFIAVGGTILLVVL